MSWLSSAVKAIGSGAAKVGAIAGGLQKVPILGQALSPVLTTIQQGAAVAGRVTGAAQGAGAAFKTALTPPSTYRPATPKLTLPVPVQASAAMPDLRQQVYDLHAALGYDPAGGHSGSVQNITEAIRRGTYTLQQAATDLATQRGLPVPNVAAMAAPTGLGAVANLFGGGNFNYLTGGPKPDFSDVQSGSSSTASTAVARRGQFCPVPAGLVYKRGGMYMPGPRGRMVRVVIDRQTCQPRPAPKRMNVLNPHALGRANRRLEGFRTVAARALKHYGYSVSTSRRPKTRAKGKKR